MKATKMVLMVAITTALITVGCSASYRQNSAVDPSESSVIVLSVEDNEYTDHASEAKKEEYPSEKDICEAIAAVENYCDDMGGVFTILEISYDQKAQDAYTLLYMNGETEFIKPYISENRMIALNTRLWYTGDNGALTKNTEQIFQWVVYRDYDDTWKIFTYGDAY